MLINKKTLGWACAVFFLFLSCSQKGTLINPDPTTTTQQSPTETGQGRDTPLHQAILGQADLASLYPFLQPTSINQPDNEGNTPLHRAVIQDNLPLVGLLLSAKANIDAQNAAGLTPLHLAAKQGNLLTLHLLLIYHGDIHAKDKEGHTPLDYIKEKQQTDQLQQILQRTPWDAIASERDPFVVAWLLAAEKTRTKDTQGWTPLHLAVCLGQTEAIQDLIANKADIEAKNSNGWTPLHLAAFLGQPEAVQLLINHQAPVDAIDHKGRTPYDIAESVAVKELLGSRMNLTKLVFHTDYENIGKRILDNLASGDSDEHLRPLRTLRETSPKMGWGLLQQERVILQLTPDKLRDIQLHRYAGLYPHVQTPHCVCPIFDPIPVTVVVETEQHARDWVNIAQDKRFLIKNALYRGNIYRWDEVRAALPEHFKDSISLSEELVDKYLEIKPIHKTVHSDNETVYSDNEKVASDNETVYSDNEKVASDNEKVYSDNEKVASDNEKVYSDNEKVASDNEKIASDNEKVNLDKEERTVVDPGNQLYNSFVGVKKLPAGKVIIGDYLAAGAFGKVYRGQWGNKAVALKQIDLRHAATKLEITSEEVEEAMQWEVARLATANHPNLVQFYGLYQDGYEGYTYMVMEFCDGGTLQDKLEKAKLEKTDVLWSQRWQWALQISQALAYLHQEGVLHRDLKAENILLDKQGRAKLADLGVAQVDALLQEAEAKVVAEGFQDKSFIAPEVEVDQTLSTKETDIYALGLVFWQIASGKKPRKINDLNPYRQEEWRRGREREAIPDDCPESIKALILECWEKGPKQRPTAQGVLAKLAALGPELDPYHHPLVTAAQKLEQLVYPKHKEGLTYIPPFVTQRALEESIESYWNWIETAKKREETVQNPPLTLAETFKEFIETPSSNTLLLLGEAGLGKTLTTYQWGDQLLDQWWAHINTGTPAPAYFPIFIRPELPTWSHAGIKNAFREVVRKYNLPKGIQPLVFIDGYDELQNDEEPTNLVEHLGLLGGNTKLIVTCRPNTVEKSAQEACFGFNGALTTRHFLPFSLDQLLGYLQKELSWNEKVYQDYKNTLGGAESVRTVLRNPFVLHLFRESWATLSQRPLRELNRWQIYEGFIEHSIQSGKNLLPKKLRKRLKDNYPNLLTSYQAFMSEVAWQSFQQKAITLGVKEAKGISPWADLPRYVEEVAKDEFAERKAKLQAAIDEAPAEKKVQLSRRSLLNEGDYVSLNQKRIGQAEAELPLKRRGEQYEYSHKSLFEYGMAKGLLLLQYSPNIVEKGIKLLNSRKIQEEPEALQFWQEGWKEPGSEVLIEPLFALITQSREEEGIQQASANSATLLAQAEVAFSGRSLQRVRLPMADLRGTILSHTCLADAQLPAAVLIGAYLGHADLRHANLSNVDFGQGVRLECEHSVYCLSYHPAGTQLALGFGNGNIDLYNMEEAYTPIATLKGHTGSILSLTYRPDGHQLASGSLDNTVGLWDPNAQQLISLLKGHTGSVRSLTYRPDGHQLASGSEDHTVGLWDPHAQQLITLLKEHKGSVFSVAYRPDGRQLASGSGDNRVGLWDPHRQQLISLLKGHTGMVFSVTYRPDGQQLASGSYDNTVGLWDPHAQQLITLLKGHKGSVLSVTYRPDGQQLASGSSYPDCTVGLWDPHRQQLLSLLQRHTDRINSVTYRPDGHQLASGSSDNTVGLWDPHRQQLISQLKGHTGRINSLTYRPDGHQLASGSNDKTVGLWNPHRQQLISQLKGHTGMVLSVTYRPDGQQLAWGSSDKTVGLWDVQRQQLISQLNGHTGRVSSVTYRPDGQQLASGSDDNTVGLWDLHRQQLITQLQGHTGRVSSVTYRPDGQQLASGSDDNTVGLWDSHAKQLISRLKGHTGSVYSVTYRPDGQQLASGSEDNTIGLWDLHKLDKLLDELDELGKLDKRELIERLKGHNYGQRKDLLDFHRQQLISQLITQLKGHTGSVRSVAYRPDGQQLASGSDDNTVGLWDPHCKQLQTLLKGHSGGVRSVCYRPDGLQLASGSEDQAIFVWARQDIGGLDKENWQLIYRFENGPRLLATGALLKGATISGGDRALLKQIGANDEEDLGDKTKIADNILALLNQVGAKKKDLKNYLQNKIVVGENTRAVLTLLKQTIDEEKKRSKQHKEQQESLGEGEGDKEKKCSVM